MESIALEKKFQASFNVLSLQKINRFAHRNNSDSKDFEPLDSSPFDDDQSIQQSRLHQLSSQVFELDDCTNKVDANSSLTTDEVTSGNSADIETITEFMSILESKSNNPEVVPSNPGLKNSSGNKSKSTEPNSYFNMFDKIVRQNHQKVMCEVSAGCTSNSTGNGSKTPGLHNRFSMFDKTLRQNHQKVMCEVSAAGDKLCKSPGVEPRTDEATIQHHQNVMSSLKKERRTRRNSLNQAIALSLQRSILLSQISDGCKTGFHKLLRRSDKSNLNKSNLNKSNLRAPSLKDVCVPASKDSSSDITMLRPPSKLRAPSLKDVCVPASKDSSNDIKMLRPPSNKFVFESSFVDLHNDGDMLRPPSRRTSFQSSSNDSKHNSEQDQIEIEKRNYDVSSNEDDSNMNHIDKDTGDNKSNEKVEHDDTYQVLNKLSRPSSERQSKSPKDNQANDLGCKEPIKDVSSLVDGANMEDINKEMVNRFDESNLGNKGDADNYQHAQRQLGNQSTSDFQNSEQGRYIQMEFGTTQDSRNANDSNMEVHIKELTSKSHKESGEYKIVEDPSPSAPCQPSSGSTKEIQTSPAESGEHKDQVLSKVDETKVDETNMEGLIKEYVVSCLKEIAKNQKEADTRKAPSQSPRPSRRSSRSGKESRHRQIEREKSKDQGSSKVDKSNIDEIAREFLGGSNKELTYNKRDIDARRALTPSPKNSRKLSRPGKESRRRPSASKKFKDQESLKGNNSILEENAEGLAGSFTDHNGDVELHKAPNQSPRYPRRSSRSSKDSRRRPSVSEKPKSQEPSKADESKIGENTKENSANRGDIDTRVSRSHSFKNSRSRPRSHRENRSRSHSRSRKENRRRHQAADFENGRSKKGNSSGGSLSRSAHGGMKKSSSQSALIANKSPSHGTLSINKNVALGKLGNNISSSHGTLPFESPSHGGISINKSPSHGTLSINKSPSHGALRNNKSGSSLVRSSSHAVHPVSLKKNSSWKEMKNSELCLSEHNTSSTKKPESSRTRRGQKLNKIRQEICKGLKDQCIQSKLNPFFNTPKGQDICRNETPKESEISMGQRPSSFKLKEKLSIRADLVPPLMHENSITQKHDISSTSTAFATEEEACESDDENGALKKFLDAEIFSESSLAHDLVNEARINMGLNAFERNPAMDDVAQMQAELMAKTNGLICNTVAYSGHVLRGASVEAIHKATMMKATITDVSQATILSPHFTEFGIGQAKGPEGLIYMCQLFGGGFKRRLIDTM